MKCTSLRTGFFPDKTRPRTISYSPDPWKFSQDEAVPRRPWIRIVGLVIIMILIVAIVALVFYYPDLQRQQALQVARNREYDVARHAVGLLRLTCFSTEVYESQLSNSTQPQGMGFAYHYKGYLIINQTFGVQDPSSFPMDARWPVRINFTYFVTPNLFSVVMFHLYPNGTSLATASYFVDSVYLPGDRPARLSDYTLSFLDEYTVYGIFDTYVIFPFNGSYYDSMKPSGSGIVSNISSLISCQL